jgi:hypothetical protein
LVKHMACPTVPDTAFYDQSGLRGVTPTTDPNAANCWTAGASLNGSDCPAGWTYIGDTGSGCGATLKRANCRFAAYPSDPTTLAKCCLGTYTANAMDATGQFGGKPPCPANYCPAQLNQSACTTSLQHYCKSQFPANAADNSACWQWAYTNWPQGLDDYCKSKGLAQEAQCKASALLPKFHGKLDSAVTAFCASPAGVASVKAGDPTCLCFSNANPVTGNAAIDDTTQLVCFNQPCQSTGYQTTNMLAVLNKCPDYCAQADIITNVTTGGGNVSPTQVCNNGAKTAQNTAATQAAAMQNPAAGSSKSIAGAVLLPLLALGVLGVVLFLVWYFGIRQADDDEEEEGFAAESEEDSNDEYDSRNQYGPVPVQVLPPSPSDSNVEPAQNLFVYE